MRDKYLIVLGDVGNRHFQSMHFNMQELGNVRKILDNVFILITKEKMNYEDIRNTISGSERGYCVVIAIDGLKAAWNLEPTKSEYLQSFFTKRP